MIRIELSPSKATRSWTVDINYDGAGYAEVFHTKFFAQLFAIRRAKQLHELDGQTVSLKIKGKNGRYQEERTYGHDPARTPG